MNAREKFRGFPATAAERSADSNVAGKVDVDMEKV